MIRILFAMCCCIIFVAQAQDFKSNSPSSTTTSKANLITDDQAEEYVYSIVRKSYEGHEASITDFETAFFDKIANPYPYIYALWFNDAVLGRYGKKDKAHQLRLIDRILNDSQAQGTIKMATQYQKQMHYMFSNDKKKAFEVQANIVALKNWQFVGPFENISKSGFYKNFGPLNHPEPNAEFLSATKAKVKWFVPANQSQEGWIAMPNFFKPVTGVVYAQTFINSPTQQDVYVNLAGGGAIKAWLNDALVFADEAERVTEFDAYTVQTKLQKGINRILIQLSFTDNSYANFAARLTDNKYRDLPSLTESSTYKPYAKTTGVPVVMIKQFAEEFFIEKIQNAPDNLLNYLLLCKVYLRNSKLREAREIVETALAKQPENVYLRLELIEIFRRENNRTLMLEELSKLRQLDPNSLFCLEVDMSTDFSNLRWEEAMQKIDKRLSVFGEDASIYAKKIDVLANQKKFQELIDLTEKLYQQYPDNAYFNRVMFNIKRDVKHDISGGLSIYENYLAKNYNYNIIKEYRQWLINNGQVDKATALVEKIIADHPYESSVIAEFADYHFNSKNYAKSEEFIGKALALSPYNEEYWAKLGDTKREQAKQKEAIDAYSKSLQFNPNQYQVINKLRLLKGQSESHNLVPAVDVDKLIKEQPFLGTTSTDAGFCVLHNEKTIILHNTGAHEEFNTYVVKIINESGIKEFKESSISYLSSQSLLIELAEIIKPSGIHIRGERHENNLVFTNLEAGDVIVFKYNFKNYLAGRFSDQYWGKDYFAQEAPQLVHRFNILIPPARKINYKWSNSHKDPIVKDVEDFRQYTWEVKNIDGLKDEPYMPVAVDIAPVLHITTLSRWQEVADWYADVASQSSTDSQDIKSIIGTLLSDAEQKSMSDFDKARKIYEYILTNIRYSSVSFRQGAYVPQSAYTTLTTRLGDCKDLSNLFIRLCEMVGIHGRMVLVDTHPNGEKDMLLPSVDFNHCIAKIRLDNNDYYIELTDRYLPFASLPNSLINSLILEIPLKGESFPSELKKLYSSSKTKDVARTYMTINSDDNDLSVTIKLVKYGHVSSILRSKFAELSSEKQSKIVEELIASIYKNSFSIENIEPITGLDKLVDSASIAYSFRVKDEVAEIASVKAFKINYPDIVALLSHFPSNTRIYPLNYNLYEDTDQYITNVSITLPEGKRFTTPPKDETFTFQKMTYSVSFKTISPSHIEVTRIFNSDRNSISAADYPAFKGFIEKISKAELRMISYQ